MYKYYNCREEACQAITPHCLRANKNQLGLLLSVVGGRSQVKGVGLENNPLADGHHFGRGRRERSSGGLDQREGSWTVSQQSAPRER